MKNEAKYIAFVKQVRRLVQPGDTEADEKIAIGMIMNSLFQLPGIFSGYISEKASKLPIGKTTPEHFYGRTESAKRLVKEIKENPGRSDKALIKFIKSRCRIHRVTSDENNSLKAFNLANPNTHWRNAYKELGIVLIRYERQTQKYVYSIDGVVYNETKAVLKKYDINYKTLVQRCNAKKKWPTWKRIEKGSE
jgi:hypothetical protein